MLPLLGGMSAQEALSGANDIATGVWAWVVPVLDAMPLWARVGLVVMVIVAGILSRLLIPAVAELIRAWRGGEK